MALAIAPYTAELEPAVKAFNHRLAQAGVRFKFPESEGFVATADAPIVHLGFVAVQDDRSVRGGYLVQEQDFWLNGRRERLGYLHLPLSEGLIDRRFSTLGVQLIMHALKRRPLLFGLGIGGHEEAFARVVSALGWKLEPVPFMFKLLHPARVARGLTAVRRTVWHRMACDMAALTGAAAAGSWAWQARLGGRNGGRRELTAVQTFDGVADDLWAEHKTHFDLIGFRDAASLRQLYPESQKRFLRWVSWEGGRPTGWVVALDTQMSADKYFGNLRVGTIVDSFGDPLRAASLIGDVTRELKRRGVDLIVSNQSAQLWRDALDRAGFVRRPSNFLFAASPALVKELGNIPDRLSAFHLTRGDGDGPINL